MSTKDKDDDMDIGKIDQIIDKHQGEASSLIQILLDIQSENNWLPKEALTRVGEKLAVPMSRIQHITTFYKHFSLSPKGKHEIHVCVGTACHVRGAERILDTVEGGDRGQARRNRPGSELQRRDRQLPRLLRPGAGDGRRWRNSWQRRAGRDRRVLKKLEQAETTEVLKKCACE